MVEATRMIRTKHNTTAYEGQHAISVDVNARSKKSVQKMETHEPHTRLGRLNGIRNLEKGDFSIATHPSPALRPHP